MGHVSTIIKNLVRFSVCIRTIYAPPQRMDGGDAVRRHGGLPRTRPVHTNAGGWRIETRAVALPPNQNVRCDMLPAPTTDHAQELRPAEPRQLDHNKKVRD